jgi:ABC-type nitrate/sulfonate/bicarbonate transport system substrate-binding protein
MPACCNGGEQSDDRQGFHSLLNLHGSKRHYQNTGLTVKKEYTAANPKVVDGFTRATIEAYAYIFKKDNKQSVTEVAAKNLRLKNVEAAEEFYLEAQEELTANPIRRRMALRSSSIMSPNKNPKAAAIKAEVIVDTSWLKRLNDEKFFDRVYAEVSNMN